MSQIDKLLTRQFSSKYWLNKRLIDFHGSSILTEKEDAGKKLHAFEIFKNTDPNIQ